ncbi:beta-microseminoprotein-like [Danio aesculapii]|uniref:beta-microseminoprotein-like n=1 Tax=Danio aesculapii TaxID=1142201 RepID=UPI0024BFFD26|nr:beta-microseminoprotein-like [Danio aesculapii]
MASLTLVLIVCAFVSLSDSCFFEPLQQGATSCTDSADNSTHQFETSWKTAKCIECYCSDAGMFCCETMATVINQTKGCVVEYNYNTCTFNVFDPDDPTFDCAYSAVEK